MINRLKLSSRIYLCGIALLFCFVIALLWLHYQFQQQMYRARYDQIEKLVISATGILRHFSQSEQAQAMSREQAQVMAKDTVRDLRHTKNEYYWIIDLNHFMIMHPIPEAGLHENNAADLKDAYGTPIVEEMVKVAKEKGGGFVKYYWPKPGSEKPLPKISYVKYFEEWGWIVGSGVYMDDILDQVNKMAYASGGVVAAILFFGLLLFWLMVRSIVRPVREVAQGLNEGAEQVAIASAEVSSASQSLSQNATEQAAAVEESSASLEEITAMSRETSNLTRGAENLMNENISKSGQSLKALIELTREMNQVEADSGQMSGIMKTIDDIAFQTNLLALNAAVEAARAGDAGAGFAVVADEVRQLALRATEASANTQELIDRTVKRVVSAAGAIREVNNDFEGIIESATLMGEKTASITLASEEQSRGMDQLSQASEDIDIAIQRIAAGAQESAAAAQEMAAQGAEMKYFAERLIEIINGRSGRGGRGEDPDQNGP